MARRAGGVEVEVSGKDAKLRAAMRRAGEAFRKNEAAMKRQRAAARRLNKGFTALRATIAGVAATAVTGLFGRGALKSAIELSKTYSALGAGLQEIAAASNVSVEALQELRLAFEADGVSSDKLDKALGRLHKTLGEARDLATYRRAYEQLGVDWQRLLEQGADAEQVLMAVADGVKSTGDQAKVAASLAQLMGRDWQRFAVVLRRGGEALGAVRKALAQGKVVTEAQATALKSLEQAYTDVANVQRAELAQATADAAEGLESLNRAFEQAETWAKTFALRVAEGVGHLAALAGWAGRDAQALAETRLEVRNLADGFASIAKARKEYDIRRERGMAVSERVYDRLIAKERELFDAISRRTVLTAEGYQRLLERGEVAAPAPGGSPSSSSDGTQAAKPPPDTGRVPLAEAWREFYREQAEIIAAGNAEVQRLDEERLREAQGVDDAIERSRIEMYTAIGEAAMRRQEEVFGLEDERLRKEHEAAEAVKAQWTEAYQAIAQAAGQAVGDMLFGFKSLEAGVRSVLSSIAAELSSLAVQPVVGSIAKSFGLPIPGAAAGGDVARSGLVMVGERGAEVVELPKGARVHPSGTGPGPSVSLHIGQLVGSVQSTDGPGVEAALARWSGPMADAITSQVEQALIEPGRMRQAVFGS